MRIPITLPMLANWKKKRAIKRYVNKLPKLLTERYGSFDYYSAGQISATIEEENLGDKLDGYALAFAMQPAQAVHLLGDEQLVLDLRREIGDICFGGNPNFTARYS